jgi:DNA/RNA endonuclease YhcR with UshA esterase domain
VPGPIALAKIRDGEMVTIEGTVTIGRTLLDTSGRRTLLEDATGAIELYLAEPDAAVRTGARLRVTGTVGKAYGAPRLRVRDVSVLGWQPPVAHDLLVAPGAATEWRLVRVTGTIISLHRAGERWLAEIATSAGTIPVAGLAGAGIPVSALGEGRRATVTGIVRRPFPTASDRRFALLPRGPADLAVGPAPAPGGSGAGVATSAAPMPAATGAPLIQAQTADLHDIAAHIGATVQVGGLVTSLEAGGVRIDDGTGTARIVLDGEAAMLVALLSPGDAVTVTGTVEQRDEAVVVVADPGALTLAGDPAAMAPDASPEAPSEASSAAAQATDPGFAAGAVLPRGAAGTGGPGAPAIAGGSLVLTALAGLVAIAANRGRERRRLRSRILARIEAFSTPDSAPSSPAEGR